MNKENWQKEEFSYKRIRRLLVKYKNMGEIEDLNRYFDYLFYKS